MKKLFIITLLLANLAAYSQPLICLNGYSKSDALAMRLKFLSTGKSVRTPTSVWFDKDIIGKMLALMNKEKPGGNVPDGIRIYFGTDASNYNTVILVSTYKFGTDPTVASGTFHQDYFEHDTTDILFKSTGINGERTNYADSTHGARLYQPCAGYCADDKECSDNNNRNFHYITRAYGEGMVTDFGDQKNGNIVTNCEWFDLTLLSELDAEMRQNHPNDYGGLRIYFARHMKTDYFSANKDAFVIEPTINRGVNPIIHMDSFNCNAASKYFDRFNTIPKNKLAITNVYMGQFLNQFLNKPDSDEKWHGLTVFNVVTAMVSNGVENGEICPTHCPGTTL